MTHRPYYEAYEDRYRQVHREKLRWFSEQPSAVVGQMIEKYGIAKNQPVLEVGCGEGRDAIHLLKLGYDVLATDISVSAISFCKRENPRYAEQFAVLDCLKDNLNRKYDFIYAIAVVHMLVSDSDRSAFYSFIRQHLSERGIALIGTMGDGIMERSSDISAAFTLQERIHEQTGKLLQIAGTSYRAVSFETFRGELKNAGLDILEDGITRIEPDYHKVMFAVVKAAGEKI